jgi:hypothetical protein
MTERELPAKPPPLRGPNKLGVMPRNRFANGQWHPYSKDMGKKPAGKID